MARKLTATERAIGELLDSRRRFVIPHFQRAFAWTEDEAGALLSDVLAALVFDARALDDAAPYLLGSIVLVKSAGARAELVVDGHQRLATLTMLLALLRDLDEDGAEAYDAHIRAPAAFDAGHAQRLLAVRPLDTEFFHRTVQQPGATLTVGADSPVDNDAQSNMLSVLLSFRDRLQGMNQASRRWLGEFLLRNCFVVETTAPNEEQAFHIFAKLNGGGKNLTDADLMKAEVIGALPSGERNYYAQIWERLQSDLGDAAFVQLFGHIRWIHQRRKAKLSVAAELEAELAPSRAPKDFIQKELEPKGRAFRSLSAARLKVGPQSVEANRLLTALSRVRFKDWVPPAIAYFSDRRPRGDEALSFVKGLDQMSYVLFINGADEGARNARYAPVIKLAAAGAPLDEILAAMAPTPAEKQRARQVLDGFLFSKGRIRAAVLLRLDEHLSDNAARYLTSQVTVEHVLPQNPPPGSPWAESWPDAQERKRWTDKLGNLALLSRARNADAANYDFDRKKREYFAAGGVTNFVLTSQVLLEKEWTPEVVARRHKALLKAACEIWDL